MMLTYFLVAEISQEVANQIRFCDKKELSLVLKVFLLTSET